MSGRTALAMLAAVVAASHLSACASHTIYTKVYEASGVAGEEHPLRHVSILGDKGFESQSGGRVAGECGAEGLAKVAVRRDFGQTLVTLLTLGIVNPATIAYQCQVSGAVDPQPGDHGGF